MTVSEWLIEARIKLAPICGDSSLLEAQILLCTTIKKERVWLLAHPNDKLEELASLADKLLKRRLNREPLAYITGKREFFGRVFEVTPATLIPRQETEMLVELAANWLSENSWANTIVDVGTGSGCIAISVALECLDKEIVGVDVSREAILIAEKNAKTLGASVQFKHQDIFSEWQYGTFDLVLSNPPYVENNASLEPELLLYEPLIALFSGEQGLEHIAQLHQLFNQMVNENGVMIIEHGNRQKADLESIFKEYQTTTFKDLAGHDRLTVIRRSQP